MLQKHNKIDENVKIMFNLENPYCARFILAYPHIEHTQHTKGSKNDFLSIWDYVDFQY